MKLLLQAHSSDEHFEDVHCVYVDITKELAQTILRRAKAFKKVHEQDETDSKEEGRLLSLRFWDHHARYLGYNAMSAEEVEALSDGGYVETQKTFEEGEETECDQMIICDNCVGWITYYKYANVEISSETVPLSEIETML